MSLQILSVVNSSTTNDEYFPVDDGENMNLKVTPQSTGHSTRPVRFPMSFDTFLYFGFGSRKKLSHKAFFRQRRLQHMILPRIVSSISCKGRLISAYGAMAKRHRSTDPL